MNLPKPLLNTASFFKPALHYISVPPTTSQSTPRERDPSIDETPPRFPTNRVMGRHVPHDSNSSGGLEPDNDIPLIDFSRTPSPTPYRARPSRSATQSEDEDADLDIPLSLRPLVGAHTDPGGRWKSFWSSGGLGAFLFGTWVGWQVYVGFLVLYVSAVGYTLVLLNRFILWTGVYKFPYPVTVTWMQLIGTHFWLLASASLTRALAQPLRSLGLTTLIAPSHTTSRSIPYRLGRLSVNSKFISCLFSPSVGISGGGLFEFERQVVLTVLPLAVIYAGKVVLSNVSYAYGTLNLYQLARIANVPLTLVFTSALTGTSHSIPILSSVLIATLNLLVACIQKSTRVTWESILAGIFSSLFVSLYPIILLRTHHQLTAAQISQGESLNGHSSSQTRNLHTSAQAGSREESRAYWQLLHYTSLLSITIVTPLVLISGELSNILRNCYFLDVPWFWFLISCSSLAAWAVFSSALALVRATCPLTANFLGVPRAAVQLVTLGSNRMRIHGWVGVSLCWAGSIWYALIRREEGRKWKQRRVAGR